MDFKGRQGLVTSVLPHEAHDRLMHRLQPLDYSDPNREVLKNIAFACRDLRAPITTERLMEVTRDVLGKSKYVEAIEASQEGPGRKGSMGPEALANYVHHSVLGADLLRPAQDMAYAAQKHPRIAVSASAGQAL